MILCSRSRRIIVWGELTSPGERRCHESRLSKVRRYRKLKEDLLLKGWMVHDFTWEVAYLGFLAQTVRTFLSALGFRGNHLKTLLKRCACAARRSPFYIWSARFSKVWMPPNLYTNRVITSPVVALNDNAVGVPASGVAFACGLDVPGACVARLGSPVASVPPVDCDIGVPDDRDFSADLCIEQEIDHELLRGRPECRSPWVFFG